MKGLTDQARTLLIMAERDLAAYRKLMGDSEIHDSIVGFHAQQVVEKCLKAVLLRHRVTPKKIHDLTLLAEMIENNRLPKPPKTAEYSMLNPFAVMLRYEVTKVEGLDRNRIGKLLDTMYRWAKRNTNPRRRG